MQALTRRWLIALGTAGATLLSFGALAAEPMAGLDPDHDGTISLDEARAAGTRAFERLDTDRDAQLDPGELKGHMTPAALQKADPDHDKMLSKDEYLTLVEQRFKAADTDHDGLIDAAELKT
jgi:Ca2+-binding EF-hand superfamily protein